MTAIFLAPHYDDVALSCGGLVAQFSGAAGEMGGSDVGGPLVLTIFGGTPAADNLTAFARWQHERWGTEGHDTVAVRLEEERAAAAALGCRTRSLPYLDAIYRGEQYLSDDALFGPLLPADQPLIAQLVADLDRIPEFAVPGEVTLYVPLAIGNHVDHQIVYEVGQVFAGRGMRVFGYEDFPYAMLGDVGERRLGAIRAALGTPKLVSIAESLPRRLDAIAAYRTQLPTIFRFTDDWRGAVLAWAERVGGDAGVAERYWPLLGGAVV
jgi:LmbE family N-acetylglucosaminyl deacetylase